MAVTYRLGRWRRMLNVLVRALLHVGLGPRHTYLLTVHGRRSGTPYSTPVTLVEEGTHRWLVAPYGEVSWVRNARAAGQVTLSRGRHTETVVIAELGPDGAAPVLKQYVTELPITRPFFDAKPHSPIEVFVAEAHRHPAFRIHGASAWIIRVPLFAFQHATQIPTSDRRHQPARDSRVLGDANDHRWTRFRDTDAHLWGVGVGHLGAVSEGG
jgi:deazaflavin-dependent oxidoreductase (nitroreductase family)